MHNDTAYAIAKTDRASFLFGNFGISQVPNAEKKSMSLKM